MVLEQDIGKINDEMNKGCIGTTNLHIQKNFGISFEEFLEMFDEEGNFQKGRDSYITNIKIMSAENYRNGDGVPPEEIGEKNVRLAMGVYSRDRTEGKESQPVFLELILDGAKKIDSDRYLPGGIRVTGYKIIDPKKWELVYYSFKKKKATGLKVKYNNS